MHFRFRKLALSALVACLLPLSAAVYAQEGEYVPSAEVLKARERFQDMKFGIFIHWGMSSLLGLSSEKPYGSGFYTPFSEWTMDVNRMDAKRYEEIADYFNPDEFNAAEWADVFEQAGARYVTITAKHHDGFSMFDSQISDYDIVDRTKFGRDPIKELKDELDKRGIAMFVYYSQVDWHHPDYFPRGEWGTHNNRPNRGDWQKYLDYQNTQIEELLTGYGDIAGVWFDGYWDRKNNPGNGADWDLKTTYDLIHKLQPGALIMNNHHTEPFPGEDVQIFEKDLPGQATQFFNSAELVVSDYLPLESSNTMNQAWGYNLQDDEQKSLQTLLEMLVGAAGRNSNFLLNTGPRPDGALQPINVATLKEIGKWMQVYGEAIYGTRGGPVTPRAWGVTTHNDKAIYALITEWEDSDFLLPFNEKGAVVEAVSLLRNGEKIPFSITENGVAINIPKKELAGMVTVLKLDIKDVR